MKRSNLKYKFNMKYNISASCCAYTVALICAALYMLCVKSSDASVSYLLGCTLLFVLSVYSGTLMLTYKATQNFSKKAMKISLFIILGAYVALLLTITVISRAVDKYTNVIGNYQTSRDYYMSNYVNFKPFETISQLYIGNLKNENVSHSYILGNFLGNVFLLSPLSILLPYLFKCMKKAYFFIPTVLLASVMIELIQMATMRGSCDIDDIILNTAGAVITFFIIKIKPINRFIAKALKSD